MNNIKKRILRKIEKKRDWTIRLCQKLVQTPSIDRETDPSSTTTKVCDIISAILDENNISYEIVEPLTGHPNLIASIGKPGGKRIILNGHLDHFGLMPREEWQLDPFSGKIKDGCIFGRGSTDMKGGISSLVTAFLVLSELEEYLKGEIVLTLFSDEETGARYGAEYIVDNCPQVIGDVVLNAEPSGLDNIRFAERGATRPTITVRGVSGHGGSPWRGKSAISQLIDFLQSAQDALHGREVTPPEDIVELLKEASPAIIKAYGPEGPDYLKRITFNIGIIRGGRKDSIVADEAEALVDIRTPLGFSHHEVLAELKQIAAGYDNIDLAVRHSRNPNYSDPFHPAFSILQENVQDIIGVLPVAACCLGGTDLRFFRLRGVPGFVYGPQPNNMAKANEYVRIDDLIVVSKVHALTAYDFLSKIGVKGINNPVS